MGYKKELKEKLEKSREFNEQLRAMGVKTNFDERSGEISFKIYDFKALPIDSTNETINE